MKRRYRAKLPALFGVLVALSPGAALATDRPCSAPGLEADPGLRARYPELLPRVRDELATLEDLDTCAHIALRLQEGAAIGVEVTLPDGRAASRTAAQREDVLPTVQALLLIPARASASTTAAQVVDSTPLRPAPEARQRRTPSSRRRSTPLHLEGDAKTLVPTLEPRALGIELSLISGARIGDGQTSFGLGALSFLELSGWLLGGELRADRYQTLTGDSRETALELALLLGKRLQFQGGALDLTLGPAIAEKGISGSDSQIVQAGTMPPPPPPREQSSGPVPRLLLGARWGFSPRSVFRTFVGIDGELGPSSAQDSTSSAATRLPLWTVGLALGATVGTR